MDAGRTSGTAGPLPRALVPVSVARAVAVFLLAGLVVLTVLGAVLALAQEAGIPVVAIAGITAYRLAFERPKAVSGEQPGDLFGARLWVVPNPSGLNAHETIDSLAAAYAEPARAAGVLAS